MEIKGVYIVKNGTTGSVLKDIVVENGIITDVRDSAETKAEPLFATAGFIDEHTHGGYGHDYFEATQEAADAVSKFHLDHGTTSFVATSVATKLEVLDTQISKIRKLKNNYADMIGLHMEGPFISVKKKGAQPEGLQVLGQFCCRRLIGQQKQRPAAEFSAERGCQVCFLRSRKPQNAERQTLLLHGKRERLILGRGFKRFLKSRHS